MSVPTAADVHVLDVPERSRFEVVVNGELAGFSEYRHRPGLIAFTHTLIDPRFEGQGLASRLVQTALSEARSQGLAVLPFCPFVRGYIAEHREEYLDLVPATSVIPSSSRAMPDTERPTATRKRYHGEAVEVSFDGARCRHAAECLRGLPTVFDLSRRPWILPDGADPDDVVRVVARCPTGALRTHPISSSSEMPSRPTEVTAIAVGPLLLRGELHVTGPGIEEHETRAALCSCGRTANAPYCDGSGTCVNWPHPRAGSRR